MVTRRKTYGQVGALALVAIMLVACSSSTVTWPPARSSGALATPAGTGVHVAIPDESGAKASQAVASGAPRATAGAVTVDAITADYTYKSELITPIAHLYGLFLDDFVIATVTDRKSTRLNSSHAN